MSIESKTQFGKLISKKLDEKHMTLRELARRSEIDVGNLSRIERGVKRPPKKIEVIERIALAFEMSKEERVELVDIAHHDNEMYPEGTNLIENTKIPILLRTIDNKGLTDEQMDLFIDFVNKVDKMEE